MNFTLDTVTSLGPRTISGKGKAWSVTSVIQLDFTEITEEEVRKFICASAWIAVQDELRKLTKDQVASLVKAPIRYNLTTVKVPDAATALRLNGFSEEQIATIMSMKDAPMKETK